MNDVSVQALDDLVKSYISLRDDYEAKKKVSSEASAKMDQAEADLMDLLATAGKTKYSVDGLGNVTRCSKISFKVPKDPEDKRQLFRFIEDKYGNDVLVGLLSINSMSLNSFFKDIPETPPGLGAPVSVDYLQLRRE